MKGAIRLITLLFPTLATQPGFAGDQGREKGGKQRPKVPQGSVTAARAAAEARRQTGGRVLSVQQQGGGFRVKVLTRCGEMSDLAFPVHPHMLWHACGFKLANDGRDTRSIQHDLGHKIIQHTVRYTELSSERFKDIWDD